MLAQENKGLHSSEQLIEKIRKVDLNDKDFWFAKDLQYILGCKDWKFFKKLIYKVASKIMKNKIDIDNHVMQVYRKMKKGDEIIKIEDFSLSRYAMELLVEQYNESSNKNKKDKKEKKKKFSFKNIFKVILVCVIISIISIFSIMYINIEPFRYIRNLYVSTAMTTRTFQWAANIFFSDAQIQQILAEIIPPELEDQTNKNGIITKTRENTIEIFDVKGSTYIGKMLVIGDPANVKVEITDRFLNMGEILSDMVKKTGAVAGINASGFVDYNGTSLGGEPVGIVIKDGEIKYLPKEDDIKIVGFDYEDNLIVGRFNKEEIEELNLRDAVEPFYLLTINGEDRIQSGDGGYGLQPRTAIGQTEDGKVLMLVIDGRKFDSIGATMKDVQDIMNEYGAINCAALDGGSSTVMYYDGEVVNRPSTRDGGNTGRYLPSAFVVYE